MRFKKHWFVSTMAAILPASAVFADFDVAPSVSGGKIVTNAFTDEGASADNHFTPFVSNVRVFDFDFDDTSSTIDTTQDPGFHPQPNSSGFSTNSNLRVGAVGGLSYYSGTGPVAFTALPSTTTLSYSFGSSAITIGTTAPSGTVNLGSPDALGEFDRHLNATLQATSGTLADGIYLAELQLTDTGTTAYATSAPIYVLYNVNADDAVDPTKEYLRDAFAPGTNLAPVPEPALLSAVGVGSFAVLRRRRSQVTGSRNR